MEAFPDIPIIGFTATPTRRTRKEKNVLAKIWDKLIYQYPIKKAILDGQLCNMRYYQIQSDIDLDDVRITAGDFQMDQLEKKVNVRARNRACVEKYLELGGGKCVIFCVDIKHTEEMRTCFGEAGITALSITERTSKNDRREMIARFDAANSKENIVMCNCMVLSEGWDCPNAIMGILARPTTSPIVYIQQLGRVLRLAPEKEFAIVVDVADNCQKKKVCNALTTAFDLRPGVKIEGDVVEQLEQKEKGESWPGGRQNGEATMQEQINIVLASILFNMPEELERSKIAWFSPCEKLYYAQVDRGKYLVIEDNMLHFRLYGETREEGRKLLLESTNLSEIDKKALELAKKFWKQNKYMWDKSIRSNWTNNAPTERQRELLRNIRPDVDCDKISQATASEIISAELSQRRELPPRPITDKQILKLRRLGHKGDVSDLTCREASQEIDRLVKSGAFETDLTFVDVPELAERAKENEKRKEEKAKKDEEEQYKIFEAIQYLAGVCDRASSEDGHGFNKFDADFGHSLSRQPWERWSAKQKKAALKMIRKYKGQLASIGIIPAQIPEIVI